MYYIWCARCLVENDFFQKLAWISEYTYLSTYIYMYLALGHVLDLADVSFCKKKTKKNTQPNVIHLQYM